MAIANENLPDLARSHELELSAPTQQLHECLSGQIYGQVLSYNTISHGKARLHSVQVWTINRSSDYHVLKRNRILSHVCYCYSSLTTILTCVSTETRRHPHHNNIMNSLYRTPTHMSPDSSLLYNNPYIIIRQSHKVLL